MSVLQQNLDKLTIAAGVATALDTHAALAIGALATVAGNC